MDYKQEFIKTFGVELEHFVDYKEAFLLLTDGILPEKLVPNTLKKWSVLANAAKYGYLPVILHHWGPSSADNITEAILEILIHTNNLEIEKILEIMVNNIDPSAPYWLWWEEIRFSSLKRLAKSNEMRALLDKYWV